MKKINFLASLILSAIAFGAVGCTEPSTDTEKKPTPEVVDPASGQPVVMEDFTVTLNNIYSGDVFLTIEPENKEAKQLHDMVYEILSFRYKDIYNP